MNIHGGYIYMHAAVISEEYTKELFLPFRCFSLRKEVKCRDVTLQGSDVAKCVNEYVKENAIQKLVVGASTKNAIIR